jgi:hypothetical protein
MNRYLLGLDRAMNVWAFPHDCFEAQSGSCARFFGRNSIPVTSIIKFDYSRASCRYTMQTFYEKGLGYDLFILDNHDSVVRKVLAVICFHYEFWKIVR